MRRLRSILAIALAATVLATGLAAKTAQTSEPTCEYSNETRHYVCGEFLDFFNGRGGLEIFGYPLTEAFYDPTHGGLYVQYFQRGRMEWHPLNQTPYEVQLGLLADELGCDYPPAQPDQIPSSNGPLHHYFPETEHVVSYAFLDYFRSHGGLDTFGYPRSEFMYEGGRVVQYFQRALMEWHPEREASSQISLANLGETYIERFGIPGDYDDPAPPPSEVGESSLTPSPFDEGGGSSYQGVTELRVSASVRYVITGPQGTQTLFVYVDDQQQQPVKGASVRMVARYPSNRQQIELGPTDERGLTSVSFEILPVPPGERVIIDVSVAYRDLERTTQTFFLVWW
ncbi:MAG: hypothetical protein PVG71_08740 [Anaerolineae bacterium]|jgi:hypothetical protein